MFEITNCSTKDVMINKVFRDIEEWLDSDALLTLIKLFGGVAPLHKTVQEKILWTNQFVDIWDYRRSQSATGGHERWAIYDDEFVSQNADLIIMCAKTLGMVDPQPINFTPNYILPLGGARYSNYLRPKKSKEICDTVDGTISVIALSGFRMIADEERKAVDSYAPGSRTEYDAINKGIELAFGLNSDAFTEIKKENINPNLTFCLREYITNSNKLRISSLAAPSSDPSRRANSRDTFEYFVKHFAIPSDSKVLLVTSQIYVPFQTLKFMDIAIDNRFCFSCIGYKDNKSNLSKPSNYLQEIKATVNAMAELLIKYETYLD